MLPNWTVGYCRISSHKAYEQKCEEEVFCCDFILQTQFGKVKFQIAQPHWDLGTKLGQSKKKRQLIFASPFERQEEVFNTSYLLELITRSEGGEMTIKIEKGKYMTQFLYCWAGKRMNDRLCDISFRDTLQSCFLFFDFIFFKEKKRDNKQSSGLNKGK